MAAPALLGPGPATLAQTPATGLIVGQVVDGASGRPLAGAIVAIAGNVNAARRPRILTRADGRFVFSGLTAGAYSITATRDGYVEGSFGRTRPGGSSRALLLRDGERTGDATVPMWRTAAIAGTIVDEAGEPQVNATIRVFRRTLVAGRREFHQTGTTRSDDRGIFRFGALMPGHYIVGSVPHYGSLAASMQERLALPDGRGTQLRFGETILSIEGGAALPASPRGPLLVYPPTYHPAAGSSDGATVVSLGPGEEYEHATLRISPVPTVSISGRLIGPDGPPVPGSLRLVPSGAHNLSLESEWLAALTDRSGNFTFPAVPSGQYSIRYVTFVASTRPDARDVHWADVPVSVGSEPIENLAVVAQPGLRIRGLVELDGSQDPTQALNRTTITIEPVDPGAGIQPRSLAVRPAASGEFDGPGLPAGRYYVRVVDSPAGWMFAGATSGGQDVTDQPLDLSADVGGVVVRFTERWSGINGTVQAARGSTTSPLVVIFPTDPAYWGTAGTNARRTRSTRANATGGFSINVPAGDYYVAALASDPGDDWRDPEMLALIARSATRATIREGEQRTVALTPVVVR